MSSMGLHLVEVGALVAYLPDGRDQALGGLEEEEGARQLQAASVQQGAKYKIVSENEIYL